MKKVTIDELATAKNKVEKELAEMFNAQIRKFEEETGCTVVEAKEYSRYFFYPDTPNDNYKQYGFEIHVKYDGQFIELNSNKTIEEKNGQE